MHVTGSSRFPLTAPNQISIKPKLPLADQGPSTHDKAILFPEPKFMAINKL
jgi:hypothetical protein